jgi:nicotinate-nucleotide adenylyltransferase
MIRKIGLLGGAFDPITIGHLKLADYLMGNNILDEVWIFPCNVSYSGKEMASIEMRLQMCSEAINDFGNDNIKLCDFEIKNNLVGTFIEIIGKFLENYGDENVQYYFIIGMDNANKIDKWEKFDELLKLISFVVIPREGYTEKKEFDWYKKEPHIYIDMYESNLISSTNVRDKIKKSNVDDKIPHLSDSVKKFIYSNGLYKWKN